MSAMFEFSVCACQIYIDIFLYIFFQSLIQSGQGKIKGKIKKRNSSEKKQVTSVFVQNSLFKRFTRTCACVL